MAYLGRHDIQHVTYIIWKPMKCYHKCYSLLKKSQKITFWKCMKTPLQKIMVSPQNGNRCALFLFHTKGHPLTQHMSQSKFKNKSLLLSNAPHPCWIKFYLKMPKILLIFRKKAHACYHGNKTHFFLNTSFLVYWAKGYFITKVWKKSIILGMATFWKNKSIFPDNHS